MWQRLLGVALQLNWLLDVEPLHSLFKLVVPILDTSTSNASLRSPHAALLRELHLVSMDEASKIPVNALCTTDLLLRDLMNNSHQFGGMVTALGGDFHQVLPLVQHTI